MANVDIKLDDDYFCAMGQMYSEWYEDIQVGIDKYIAIMESIVADAIMEGATAEALKVFIRYAKNLSGIVQPIGTECKGLCVNFMDEVVLRGVSSCHVTRQMLSDKYRLSRVKIFSKRLNKFIATGEFPVDPGDTCHLCFDHGSSLAVIDVLMEYETRSLA